MTTDAGTLAGALYVTYLFMHLHVSAELTDPRTGRVLSFADVDSGVVFSRHYDWTRTEIFAALGTGVARIVSSMLDQMNGP